MRMTWGFPFLIRRSDQRLLRCTYNWMGEIDGKRCGNTTQGHTLPQVGFGRNDRRRWR